MDIQEMVDRRIAELRTESGIRSHRAGSREARAQDNPSPYRQDDHSFIYDTAVDDIPDAQREFDKKHNSRAAILRSRSVKELMEFGEIMDAALTKVAGQVLEITEQLAGDYARLEKNILKTRLEALQAVESVLDVALLLRREARERLSMIEDGLRDESPARFTSPPKQPESALIADEKGRASMHDGVAALFRRTL